MSPSAIKLHEKCTIMRLNAMLLVLFLISVLTGCNRSKQTRVDDVQQQNNVTSQALDTVPAKMLVTMYCYSCHNPQAASHDVIIAPPLAAIKYRYNMVHRTRDSFISAVAGFVQKPQQDKAIMPGAVIKFGLMPVTALSNEQADRIASWLYDNQPDEPTWFKEHFDTQHGGSAAGQ